MGQSTEELTTEIAGTRQRMSADIDALQDRVSPSAIIDRRKQAARSRVSSVRDKVMGKAHDVREGASTTGSDAVGGIQGGVQNAAGTAQAKVEGSPLGAGLIAFGAGMVLAGLFPATRAEASAASAVVDTAQDKGQPLVDHARSVGQDVGQDLKESATQAAQQVKETATDAASRVQGEGQTAVENVRSDAQG